MRPRDGELFLHERALPIKPIQKPFEVQQGNLHYIRKQFPLTLAYAMTAHKCQGSTLDEVIVDFRGIDKETGYIDNGSFYVAITRVTEASKLYLRTFERKHIKVDPKIEWEINTMRMARSYQMKKVYTKETIFEEGEEIKVGYLNINNLLQGYHAEYINGDHNLRGLDILTVAETHLTSEVSTEHIETVLPNWEVKFRFDSPDQKPHMGLLVMTPKENCTITEFDPVESLSKDRDGQCQVQTIQCGINGHSFSFVYSRTTPSIGESEWLMEKTTNSHYLMGDLNLDQNVSDQKNKLKVMCGSLKKSLLKETTTKNNNQLDHILGVQRKGVRIFTTSYTNLAADHKSIILRISENGANFVDDPRLPRPYEEVQIINIEEESCEQNPDALAMPPPPAPPPRKKRKLSRRVAKKTD